MDPYLLKWKEQEQSFLSRCLIWVDLLDPQRLISGPETQNIRDLPERAEKPTEEDGRGLLLPPSSVHAVSGGALSVIFHLPALLPMSAPVVVGSVLPHRSVPSTLFTQFMMQVYFAGFNRANRNSSFKQSERTSLQQLLLTAGTVSFVTAAGALPQIFINRLNIRSAALLTFFRSLFPIPLSASLAFFNLRMTRSEETEIGIQVFNCEGKCVGRSKAAGEKAVRETALSRAAMIGTTTAVPNLLVVLLERKLRLPTVFHPMTALFVLGVMIPVSFSLFPQLGTVTEEEAEGELRAAAIHGHLYYHRGV